MADVKAFALYGGKGFKKGTGGNPVSGRIKDIDEGALCDTNERDSE